MQEPLKINERGAEKSRWWVLIGLFVLSFIIYALDRILIPFVVAGLLSYIFRPVVTWLEQRLRSPRFLIVLAVYILFLAPLSMLMYWLGPSIAERTEQFIREVPNMINALVHRVFDGEQINFMGVTLQADLVSEEVLKRLGIILKSPEGLVQIAEYGLEVAIGVILTLVVLFYFLMSSKSLAEIFVSAAPPSRRPRISYFAEHIDLVVGKYLRGLLLIIIFQCVTTWIGLEFFFDLPYAIPLALIVGLLEPIPGIGPILAFVVAAAFTILFSGFWATIEVLGFIGLLRIVVDNIIGPIILGWAVTLHPVLIIFSLLAGVALFGVVGLLLAIPLAASVKVLIDEWEQAPQ